MNLFQKTIRTLSIVPILAGFVSVNLAQAAGSPAFNNLTGDQDFLTGRNVTQGEHTFTDPVHANASEEVEVAVYYHNTTADSTAHNTTIKIQMPTNLGKQHIVSGTLSADGVTPVSGTIVSGMEVGPANFTINSDTDTNLSFVPDSVRWFPDYTQHPGAQANLPTGQDGNSIISSTGLNLGDIAGCFAHAGFVTFKVRLVQPNIEKPTLEVTKLVRSAEGVLPQPMSLGDFSSSIKVAPGVKVQYALTVHNAHATVAAQNVNLRDVLPQGVTYVGPATVHFNTTVNDVPNNGAALVTADGVVVISSLPANSTVTVTFIAQTATTFKDNDCTVNTVTASAANGANTPQATAQVCFTVPNTVKPTIEISKGVRRAGSTDNFTDNNRVNPGNQLEYQLTIRNADGAKSVHNVVVNDYLPAGAIYLGPTVLHQGTAPTTLPNKITSTDGVVIPEIKPGETVYVNFAVNTDTTLAQDACIVNKVKATSSEANNAPEATAKTCFDIVKQTPPPTPQPELPKTGPEANLIFLAGFTGMGGSAARYWSLKNKLKKSLQNIEIL